MDLALIWFVLLAVLMAGYAVLDGFDLGVGIIHPLLSDAGEKNAATKAIGPLWDGNEVWLVTFGGALFAAFPEAYASVLSGFYLPVMLLLFSLILRAVSIDFRNKVLSRTWQSMWDIGLFVSSLAATLVLGVAAGNLIQGIALDEQRNFVGTTRDLFGWYPLAVGLLAVLTFALHGVVFLILKSTDAMRKKLTRRIWHFWGVFVAVYILVTIMTLVENPHVADNVRRSYWPIPIVIANVLAIANLPRTILNRRFGQAFISSATSIACMVGLFFCSLFPWIVISTGPGDSISIQEAASSQSTLWLMLIIAVIGMPMVLAYTVVVYWTFRHPVAVD